MADEEEPSYPPPQYYVEAMKAEQKKKPRMDSDSDSDEGEEEGEEGSFYKFVPAVFVELIETDEKRLEVRQRQIDMGKNTIGYQNYVSCVPKRVRAPRNIIHPSTPDIAAKISKRNFDGRVKAWRRALHFWDVLPGTPITPAQQAMYRDPRSQTRRAKEARSAQTPMPAPTASAARPRTIFDKFDSDDEA